jgi:hypothetical protein
MYGHGIPTPGSYAYGDGDKSFDSPIQVNEEAELALLCMFLFPLSLL